MLTLAGACAASTAWPRECGHGTQPGRGNALGSRVPFLRPGWQWAFFNVKGLSGGRVCPRPRTQFESVVYAAACTRQAEERKLYSQQRPDHFPASLNPPSIGGGATRWAGSAPRCANWPIALNHRPSRRISSPCYMRTRRGRRLQSAPRPACLPRNASRDPSLHRPDGSNAAITFAPSYIAWRDRPRRDPCWCESPRPGPCRIRPCSAREARDGGPARPRSRTPPGQTRAGPGRARRSGATRSCGPLWPA